MSAQPASVTATTTAPATPEPKRPILERRADPVGVDCLELVDAVLAGGDAEHADARAVGGSDVQRGVPHRDRFVAGEASRGGALGAIESLSAHVDALVRVRAVAP